MTTRSRKDAWQKFRAHVIELDKGKCIRCGKSKDDGSVLHVHHKAYIEGRNYWDYPYEMVETLCAGCHAKEHGIISPDCGWSLISDSDLGGMDGICDYCGRALRYVFHIEHTNWPTMDVGRDCCDLLTQTDEATVRERKRKNVLARRERFIESGGWDLDDDGSRVKIIYGYRVRLVRESAGYRIWVGLRKGEKHHSTLRESIGAAFDAIQWLEDHR